MGIVLCEKHGEAGVIPTVSKQLADAMRSGLIGREDIRTLHLRVFDDGEFLFEKMLFLHKAESDGLDSSYLIRNEEEDEIFARNIQLIFRGGGYCVKCFKEYMEKLDFDLNALPAHHGITY